MSHWPGGQTNSPLYTPVRPRSASESVQEQIQELLHERRLGARDRLPAERDLAALLGVSRATLREALVSLSEKGIVSSRQGAGWYVNVNRDALVQNMVLHFRLSDVSFEDLVTARTTMEPQIASLAAARHTPDELAAIEATLRAMTEAPDVPGFLTADSNFHEALAQASHNPFFIVAVTPALAILEKTRAFVVEEARDEIVAAHARILAAVRRRDARRASSAMLAHLNHFIELELRRQAAKAAS